jgi:hypothetical protein
MPDKSWLVFWVFFEAGGSEVLLYPTTSLYSVTTQKTTHDLNLHRRESVKSHMSDKFQVLEIPTSRNWHEERSLNCKICKISDELSTEM